MIKNQLKFISLNDFEIIMTKIFFEFVVNFDSIIINFSSRFHIYFECDIQFSSISRFLFYTQKNCNKVYTCKHCEKIFTSNNKLHMHVRLHYIKFDKTLKQRFVERKNNHINLSISRFIFSITFKLMTTSTKSSFLIIFMTKTFVVCIFIFSVTFFVEFVANIDVKTSRIASQIIFYYKWFVRDVRWKIKQKKHEYYTKKIDFSCFSEFR